MAVHPALCRGLSLGDARKRCCRRCRSSSRLGRTGLSPRSRSTTFALFEGGDRRCSERATTIALDDGSSMPGEEGEDLEIHGVHLRVARDKLRTTTVTDMAYLDGEFSLSRALRTRSSRPACVGSLSLQRETPTSSLEIYHVSHGNTRRPRRFAPSCRTATGAFSRATPARRSSTSPWRPPVGLAGEGRGPSPSSER